MRKSDILAALEKIPGDPEIGISAGAVESKCDVCGYETAWRPYFTIDRINEYPRPEIVVIEK